MIATSFIDLSSNELWEEILWLEEQPLTEENAIRHDLLLKEFRNRQRRRAYLEESFEWS